MQHIMRGVYMPDSPEATSACGGVEGANPRGAHPVQHAVEGRARLGVGAKVILRTTRSHSDAA